MTDARTTATKTTHDPSGTSPLKVVVGLSGGVDSSVAAALLKEAGYVVEGLFMKNWEEDDGTEYCTALADLEDAKRVAEKLDIELHTANFAAEYWDNVFEEFLSEYSAGRTPNPDVLCNREIKFNQFVRYAQTLGADRIATGHYARWHEVDGQRRLGLAADANKDQTYFLQAVTSAQLADCLFPLGDLSKSEVREMAAARGLHNHERKDSTGICFIGERRFSDFIDQYIARDPGPIRDAQGLRLGSHDGLHHFTKGQRQGINLGGIAGRSEAPWYVLDKSLETNTLIVTQREASLYGSWLQADRANWLVEVELPVRCLARIRHRQKLEECTVSGAANGRLLVHFERPQRAIAEGQYIALYRDDLLLGGARIDRSASCPLETERNQTESAGAS